MGECEASITFRGINRRVTVVVTHEEAPPYWVEVFYALLDSNCIKVIKCFRSIPIIRRLLIK